MLAMHKQLQSQLAKLHCGLTGGESRTTDVSLGLHLGSRLGRSGGFCGTRDTLSHSSGPMKVSCSE